MKFLSLWVAMIFWVYGVSMIFYFYGIFQVFCVMLCGELVIFLALAFVKVPWMMTGDCGWATIFFFFFFKEQIDDEFEYWKKKNAPSDRYEAHKQYEKY